VRKAEHVCLCASQNMCVCVCVIECMRVYVRECVCGGGESVSLRDISCVGEYLGVPLCVKICERERERV
jgi:hypothetical protein